jgi:hypothetical protein
MKNSCRIFVGKPDRIKPIGIRRRRWINNMKMDILVRVDGMDWILVAQDKVK